MEHIIEAKWIYLLYLIVDFINLFDLVVFNCFVIVANC